jgi:hypothetical protein
MKESEFMKLNFKFEVLNFCANVQVKITSLRTAVRQLANTLTVREFSKWIVCIPIVCKYFIFVVSMEMREKNQSHVCRTLFEVKRT